MQTILVTGGAGYIGIHTVVELVQAGYRPVVVDNFSTSSVTAIERAERLLGKKIAYYKASCGDQKIIRSILQKEHIEGIIHFAAFKFVGESVADPLKYYDNNVGSFTNLLKATAASGIRAFIFSSTAAVYGAPPQPAVTEDMPCQPESPYGWSKYMDEIILKNVCQSADGFSGTALRYFNVVGSHESAIIGDDSRVPPQNLLPLIIRAARGESPALTVFGKDYPTKDGTCFRDYIHVVDLAKAHVLALKQALATQKEEGFRVYNVGTGKPASVLELIRTFEKTTGVPVPYIVGKRRPGDPVGYFADTTRLTTDFGWRAERTIEDACRDAWKWEQVLSAGKASAK